jgi:2-methylisocitrate lyase-like PEP mutase family enzyme
MSRLGMADLGVATLNDMRDHAAMIASIDPTVPLVADADTGYGGTPLFPQLPLSTFCLTNTN